jgi:ketosteroid isomerase-like protein
MENTEKELLQLANSWIDAEKRGDSQFLEDTLTDDFIGIGPLGFMLSKNEWIERHKSGDLKYESLDLKETNVRVYNDAAILIGRQEQKGAYKGNSMNAQFRISLVFVKHSGKWKIAGLQLSAIGQPPVMRQR